MLAEWEGFLEAKPVFLSATEYVRIMGCCYRSQSAEGHVEIRETMIVKLVSKYPRSG